MKYVAVKNNLYTNDGDVVSVICFNEDTGMVTFYPNDYTIAHMGIEKFNECFNELPVENTSTNSNKIIVEECEDDYISYILHNSEITHDVVFDSCVVVHCKLPNGYIIVESSTCTNPNDFDKEVHISMCVDKIAEKVWEFEEYHMLSMEHDDDHETYDCDGNCENCEFNEYSEESHNDNHTEYLS